MRDKINGLTSTSKKGLIWGEVPAASASSLIRTKQNMSGRKTAVGQLVRSSFKASCETIRAFLSCATFIANKLLPPFIDSSESLPPTAGGLQMFQNISTGADKQSQERQAKVVFHCFWKRWLHFEVKLPAVSVGPLNSQAGKHRTTLPNSCRPQKQGAILVSFVFSNHH